jgi:hypothetical protein
LTRRILTKSVGPLHSITLTIPNPNAFREWRVEVRNRVDYLRHADPFWKSFGFNGWLQCDGTIQGIVALGPLGPPEVTKGLARWDAVLGVQIEPESLRAAIWSATKPQVISLEAAGERRYQGRHFSISPCRSACPNRPAALVPNWVVSDSYDPMPVLFS